MALGVATRGSEPAAAGTRSLGRASAKATGAGAGSAAKAARPGRSGWARGMRQPKGTAGSRKPSLRTASAIGTGLAGPAETGVVPSWSGTTVVAVVAVVAMPSGGLVTVAAHDFTTLLRPMQW
jgi:hypothetical protein